MQKMPDRISDGPAEPQDTDFAEYSEPDPDYDFEEDRQRRVDDDRKLLNEIGAMIRHVDAHNSFPKGELIDLLKRAKRRIDRGFYGF
jgi:hypothetical protein